MNTEQTSKNIFKYKNYFVKLYETTLINNFGKNWPIQVSRILKRPRNPVKLIQAKINLHKH